MITLFKVISLCAVIPVALLVRYIIQSRTLDNFVKNFEGVDALDGRVFVHILPNAWPLGSPPFFVDPYGFLSKWAYTLKVGCTDCFTGKMRLTKLWFKFRVKENRVLVPFGSAVRRTILTDRRFNSMMGYALMTSTIKNIIPLTKSQSNISKEDANFKPSIPFAWLFRKVVRQDVMEKYPSMILKDIDSELRSWNKQGVLDPFDKLRRLLIIPVLRITLGSEILSSPSRIKETISGLIAIEEANGLPDFPIQPLTSLWSMVFVLLLNPFRAVSLLYKKSKRFVGGMRMYNLFVKAVEERRLAANDNQQQDILQTLLEEDREGPGIDNGAIAERLIMALFTAGGSSSSVYPWLQILLCEHPHWKLQVEKEVDNFLEEHVQSTHEDPPTYSFQRILDSLSQLDLSTWEDSFPVLEKCLRETLRLVMVNAVPRMNVGDPLDISPATNQADGAGLSKEQNTNDEWPEGIRNHTTVEKGGFVFYLISDVHLDETIYPDPSQFNPARDYTDEPTDFLGWGVGLHTCIGQRLAKIMIKVVTVILMNQFEFGLADRVPCKDERSIPRYRLFGIGKPEKTVTLKYRRRY